MFFAWCLVSSDVCLTLLISIWSGLDRTYVYVVVQYVHEYISAESLCT